MEPNKPLEMPEEGKASYSPIQLIILRMLRLSAWILVFEAVLYAMHSL